MTRFFNAWLNQHREELLKDYLSYLDRHADDIDPIVSFETWAMWIYQNKNNE